MKSGPVNTLFVTIFLRHLVEKFVITFGQPERFGYDYSKLMYFKPNELNLKFYHQ